MKRKAPWILTSCAALLAVAFVILGNAPTSSHTADVPEAVSTTVPGLTAHIDPDTKQLLDTRPAIPANILRDPTGPYSRSSAGLVQQPAPVGGGQMVDLQGRFQESYTATVDPSGNLTAGCGVHEEAEESTQKSEKE